MDAPSTSYENTLESISSTDRDTNTIVEAVNEGELLFNDKPRISKAIQTQPQRNSLKTDSHHRYKCPQCERGFQNVGPLKCHYGKAHRNSTPLLLLFDSSLVCKICNKSFDQKAEFDLHTKSHLKKNETEPLVHSHQCHLCQMSFPWKAALENHYHSHNDLQTLYTCVLCKSYFLDLEKLNEHYVKHLIDQKDNPCINCYDKPICACHEKEFSGGINEASFNVKKDLESHCTTHTEQKLFKCNICSAGFSNQRNLKRHADIHSGKKPFECEVCKKSFRTSGGLKQHCSTHTKERPFQCEVCDKCFSRKSILEVHERTHSKERPYVCQECNKGYTQLSSLQAHFFVHTNEKPFQCDLCNKAFSIRGNLKSHQLRRHKK